MKILYVSTISNTINAFMIPHIQMLIDQGHNVDIACNVKNDIDSILLQEGCRIHNIKIERSPLRINNLKAAVDLRRIIKSEKYELVHVHTPVASVFTRVACLGIKKIKIIYTAHGFHFFSGASIKNWLCYYPIEKILSKKTDAIITMNDEDYSNAIKIKSNSANSVFKVNGVGIDLDKFRPKSANEKKILRESYGFGKNDFIIIYVGELSKRKNQTQAIKAMNILSSRIPNIKLLLVGKGPLANEYEKLILEMKLEKNVILMGYRKDIPNLMRLSDLVISTSRQEGLPVNVMEAMATGLPLVVTNSRGNRDLVKNGENGYVVNLNNEKQLADAIEKLYLSNEKMVQFGKKNIELIKKYSLKSVLNQMESLYIKYLN